jgi:hypothetical protein
MKTRLGLLKCLIGMLSISLMFLSYGESLKGPLYYSVSCAGVDTKAGVETFLFPARDFEVRTNDKGLLEISAVAMIFSSIQIANPHYVCTATSTYTHLLYQSYPHTYMYYG